MLSIKHATKTFDEDVNKQNGAAAILSKKSALDENAKPTTTTLEAVYRIQNKLNIYVAFNVNSK